MMDWYITIKNYYDAGIYTKEQVGMFVTKGKIDANQYKMITGFEFI